MLKLIFIWFKIKWCDINKCFIYGWTVFISGLKGYEDYKCASKPILVDSYRWTHCINLTLQLCGYVTKHYQAVETCLVECGKNIMKLIIS